MNYLITPNMQLPNPVPGVDPGPDYANNLQSSLNIIDQHNHSAGNGVQINPSGLDINADLPFNANNATLLRSTRYSAQLSPISLGTDLGCLYVSGVDLYYNDVNGNQIQITSSGTVNATSSGIVSGTASAAFSGGVLVVKSSSTSGANVLLKSVELTNSGNLTNILTLQAPTLSGSSTQTLPATPAQTNIMTMDSSGNMEASWNVDGSTIVQSSGVISAGVMQTANYGAGSITNSKLAALNYAASSSISFSTASATLVSVTGASVTLTTSGRPVAVGFQSDGNASVLAGIGISGTAGSIGQASITFNVGATVYSANQPSLLAGTALPSNCLPCVISGLSAGSNTIFVQAKLISGTTLSFANLVLYAYEIS